MAWAAAEKAEKDEPVTAWLTRPKGAVSPDSFLLFSLPRTEIMRLESLSGQIFYADQQQVIVFLS
jgi:hypothetical protein